MKKVLSIVLLCVLIVLPLLVSCAPQKPIVGFFVYDENDTYMGELTAKVKAEVDSKVNLDIKYASRSQSVQNRQILDNLKQNTALIAVNLVDRLSASSIVEKCEQQKLPLVFFNREPLDGDMSSSRVYYVGANADNQGILQAEMLNNLFGEFVNTAYDKNGDGKIQTIIFKGEQGHQDAEKRTKSCLNELKNYGYSIDILGVTVADWSRNKAESAMQDYDKLFGESIELILCNNDDMALGAVDFLKGAGKLKEESASDFHQDYVIVGVDATEAGLKAVKDGYMYGTVLNDSLTQSKAIALLMQYLLQNKDLQNFPYTITNRNYIYIDGKIILKYDIK
ncbi:MAG: galactose ABC transporter substrate-binding protein [Clostridia bacterium]